MLNFLVIKDVVFELQRYLLGMDGLGEPVILGTGFYIKRSASLGELPGG